MSNLILCELDSLTAVINIEPIQNINKFLKKHRSQFTRVDVIGGSKAIETAIWIAAINHFSFENLIDLWALINEQNWIWPKNVQLFIKEENDHKFREYWP